MALTECFVRIKKTVILMMVFLLSACGYHLRGALTLPAGLKSIFLKGGSPQLQEQFASSMKVSSVPVASAPESADLIIRIYNENNDRRVLSLNAGGTANDFELDYNLEYELVDSKNKVLMPRQPISIKREYYNNQQAILAKDNEELIIRHEMYQQAIRSIVGGAKTALDASSK